MPVQVPCHACAVATEATVDGKALTPEVRILAALVKRLGGEVKIPSSDELASVQGLVIDNGHITAS